MFKLIVLLMIVTDCAICSKLELIKHVQSESTAGSLQNDLDDFLRIIPVDDIRNLTEYFYANDEAMRESYDYVRDHGVKLVCESLSQLSLVKKFTAFLNDTGVNFAALGKRIEEIVLTGDEAKSIVGNCWGLIAPAVARGADLLFLSLSPFLCFSVAISQRERRRHGRHECLLQRGPLPHSSRRGSDDVLLENGGEQRVLVVSGEAQRGRLWKFDGKSEGREEAFDTKSRLKIPFSSNPQQRSQGLQAIYFDFHAHGVDIMEWAKSLRGFFGYWAEKRTEKWMS